MEAPATVYHGEAQDIADAVKMTIPFGQEFAMSFAARRFIYQYPMIQLGRGFREPQLFAEDSEDARRLASIVRSNRGIYEFPLAASRHDPSVGIRRAVGY